jgi:hypothetical protein
MTIDPQASADCAGGMKEYAQTHHKRISEAAKANTLEPPEGKGWELHSWQLAPAANAQYIVAVWERDKPTPPIPTEAPEGLKRAGIL